MRAHTVCNGGVGFVAGLGVLSENGANVPLEEVAPLSQQGIHHRVSTLRVYRCTTRSPAYFSQASKGAIYGVTHPRVTHSRVTPCDLSSLTIWLLSSKRTKSAPPPPAAAWTKKISSTRGKWTMKEPGMMPLYSC